MTVECTSSGCIGLGVPGSRQSASTCCRPAHRGGERKSAPPGHRAAYQQLAETDARHFPARTEGFLEIHPTVSGCLLHLEPAWHLNGSGVFERLLRCLHYRCKQAFR